MNILHISGVRNWGGGENHIENLYNEVKTIDSTVNQTILCVKGGRFAKTLQQKKIPYTEAKLDLKIDPRFILKIIYTCLKKRIDVVHLHDPTALTFCVIADRISGKIPKMIYAKKTSFPIKNRKPTLYKYNYKKIEKYICVSKAVEKVTKKHIIDKHKTVTIYNGIRFENLTDQKIIKLRKTYKISKNIKIIGSIGNHIRAKNLFTFIEVVNYIVNIKKETRFVFVQIGKYTERSKMYLEKVKEYQLTQHIIFTDFINNAAQVIPQFDIFLLTSQSEGLPQVINQAFYHKTPVVSTNPGGIPEIIKDGINGFLSEVEDYQTLGDKILTLDADQKLKKSFVEKSYKQVSESFSTHQMGLKTLNVYKSLVN